MRLEQFRGDRVAVLGFGREGQSAWRLLKQRADLQALEVWCESGALPTEVSGRVAEFDQGLAAYDVVLRSPGVPVDHPALREYRRQGGRIVNPSSIFLSERPELPVIGVTGSKGKSTTASLLAHLLRAESDSVVLAGNIGLPLLDQLDTTASLVVAELSSYQLADLEGRLRLGIITRLFPEHLDWHGSVEAYYAVKLRLAELLDGQPLIINGRDPVLKLATSAVPGRIESNRAPFFNRREDELMLDQAPLLRSRDLRLVGRHNLDNAALALEAACLLGRPLMPLLDALRSFQALEHRLETVSTAGERRWINDSIATSPHATLAALESAEGHPVVLLVGGQDRPSDWAPVAQWCQRRPLRGLVVLPDNGDRVARALEAAGAVEAAKIRKAEDLDAAIAAAVQLSRAGDTILLSPGAPSFPRFRNFEARGLQFREAIQRYLDRSTA
ncbi:UDP-N-acetylmuramoyl-L-alanine--D-glutamate ligase [Wenzhouxiangella marina]|uniref:UDP-N-acetylmuramoylalanine--D-glutamate ligase n=1 Tax=Wenzhouxiangella marina TaxID=1579979 RepID=A0A0K0XXG3_9GAMM|nr:UDP-N-acetylmuramoyl-L-alanine--D-glutamate ligase [Wenzhouxiangella marina]AKS42389.1 UDP-N-acetylmuramoylalanine--D-glutamate ligase [Wenzhouxiangella marina]MBB6085838.1 UDP-N-acetylmuramoylalanine--D-glutamate ligase [Wenzhouxiangella marina]